MPFVVTLPPTQTLTVSMARVFRFVINTGHEIVTIQSKTGAIALEK